MQVSLGLDLASTACPGLTGGLAAPVQRPVRRNSFLRRAAPALPWQLTLKQTGGRGAAVTCAYNSSYGELHDPWKEEEHRQALINYVQQVEPGSVAQFVEQAAPCVVSAMQQTIKNVVGSLPPQYFEVRINTVAESLAQLMLSIMTTGYMFRSAQFRLELQQTLSRAQLQAPSSTNNSSTIGFTDTNGSLSSRSNLSSLDLDGERAEAVVGSGGTATAQATATSLLPYDAAFMAPDSKDYAPGIQKNKVEGEVLRWHNENGLQRMPALTYIELLEAEVAALRAQVQAQQQSQQLLFGGLPPFPSAPVSSPIVPPPLGGANAAAGAGGVGPIIDTIATPASGTGSNKKGTFTNSTASVAGGALDASAKGAAQKPHPGGPLHSAQQFLSSLNPFKGGSDAANTQHPGAPPRPRYSGSGLALGGLLPEGDRTGASPYPAMASMDGGPAMGSPLGGPRNDLLEYLKALQASGGLKELASSPRSGAVKEAMEVFVGRLMGSSDPEVLRHMDSEFSAMELSKVLMWLMVVGYTLRSLESRMDIQDSLDMGGGSSGPGGLLPGL